MDLYVDQHLRYAEWLPTGNIKMQKLQIIASMLLIYEVILST